MCFTLICQAVVRYLTNTISDPLPSSRNQSHHSHDHTRDEEYQGNKVTEEAISLMIQSSFS